MGMRMKDSLGFLSEMVTLAQCIDLQLNSVEGGNVHFHHLLSQCCVWGTVLKSLDVSSHLGPLDFCVN